MKLKLLKDQKWTFNMLVHEYKAGQILSITDIPENIAGDMVKYGYAIEINSLSPAVENKMVNPVIENKSNILASKIQQMSREELLKLAQANNITIDKRWNMKNLLNKILGKII